MDLVFAPGRIGHAEYTALIAASDAFDPRIAAPAELALQKALVDRFGAMCDKFVEVAREPLQGRRAGQWARGICRNSRFPHAI
jgi:hypothetical protein